MGPNILGTIGNTPLVRLNRLPGENSAEICAKLELFNPGGSVKDRIGLSMVEAEEKEGKLKAGDVIVEPTSGNTGIALAMVAAVKGYKAVFTMPETMSLERRKLLTFLGAEIILTDGTKGMKGAIEKAEELVKEKGYFMPMQFDNAANPEIHRITTGVEIIGQLNGRKLDYFVVGIGTGGTISGAGLTLREEYPDIKLIAVEPQDSPVLSGGAPGPHQIQGIGAGFVPNVYNAEIVDEVMTVSNEDALETSRRLAREEGILAGISSGANAFAALQVAKSAGVGMTLVVVLPDTAERYLTTALFDGQGV